METINVNGTEYVKAEDARTVNLADPSEWEHVCVIADRGWIFEGYRSDEDPCTLRDAHVVRKWSNGDGYGGGNGYGDGNGGGDGNGFGDSLGICHVAQEAA